MATHRFISLAPEFVKALQDEKAAKAAKPAPDAETETDDEPEATDEPGDEDTEDGPEADEATDSLRALAIKAWKAWLDAHGEGGEPVKGMEWTAPESPAETAAEFAERAAKHLRDTDEGEAAADAIGEGEDFIDWVTAVMRYEGGSPKEAAEKSLGAFAGEEMVKGLGSASGLTADETMMVLSVRLVNSGEAWVKAKNATKPESINGPCCAADPYQDCTPEEFADLQADSAVERLMWDGSTLIPVMRKLGGVMQYHDWTRDQVLEGIHEAQEALKPAPVESPNDAVAVAVPEPAAAPVA